MMSVVYRMKVSGFSVCKVCGDRCCECGVEFPETEVVAKLFDRHGKLALIRDSKDRRFFKGGVSKGNVVGERVLFLPDGRKLNKAYSLFAKNLVVHDEKSNSHWDVIFENPNGKMAYLYDLDKVKLSNEKKYECVAEFEKCLGRLKKNLMSSLDSDSLALPMLILLKTKMRVGNEMYYLKNGHKGLTTLKKKDIKISGDFVTFDYIGKDGVPQKIREKFSLKVIAGLKKLLKGKDAHDFVFVDLNGHTLKDTDFEKAFIRHCGERFYPHIVRSHYATRESEKFLEKNGRPSREACVEFCLKLADKLGHKKFSKKTGGWEDSYRVTLHHYVKPELVERFNF
ncbi:MAG: hypothetical protein KJ592_03295 [Nanoarchaeota archaeon]|nr:hypothetical protein [Nanoarchaeota archaeon]